MTDHGLPLPVLPDQAGLHDLRMTVQARQLHIKYHRPAHPAELVVLIHGLACNLDSYTGVWREPRFQQYAILAVDLLGFGGSDKPVDFDYGMRSQAELMAALLSPLQLPVHIVAHSMGGAIGLLLSPSLLPRLRSFANLEGNLIDEDCGLFSRAVAAFSRDDFEGEFAQLSQQLSAISLLHLDQTTPQALHASATSLVRWSQSGELLRRYRALPCRTHYFYGEQNRAMPVLKQLRGVPHSMVAKAGHGFMLDNPQVFYPMLAGFIESARS